MSVFWLLLAAPAQAATFTVTNANDSGPGSLRQAILDANGTPGADTITFAAGVTGTITLTSGQLTVTDDLTIDGPGSVDLTISGNNASRVMEVSAGATLDLRDVTVADGLVCSPPVSAAGAGILNFGTLGVTNTTFSGNVASQSSCAAGPGGAIANSGGTVTVSNSTFSGNSGTNGGAISNSEGGTLSVSSSTYSGNSASEWGGGIFSSGGTLSVTTSTFVGNSDVFSGGGIANFGGTATVSDSTLTENTTSFAGGGGIWNHAGTLNVTNTTFSENSATFAGFSTGGGIQNTGGGVTVVINATFSGNSAGTGGGIHNELGASLTLENTIVANSPSGANCSGVIADGGGNLSWPDSTCPGINQDPLLDPTGLQNNGGPTQTIALQTESPAIDAAVDANCPATDQRGVARPQGEGCDIGAFELVTNNPPSCASVVASPNRLWPPNHKLRLVTLSGATDPDGDTVTLTITGVTQDESVSGLGGGDISPDAQAGTQSTNVFLRAERSGTGDGRVYRISFTGADGKGDTCSGSATVGVPKSLHSTPVDSAPPSYNSFGP